MPNLTVNTNNLVLTVDVQNPGITITPGDTLELQINPANTITLEIPVIPNMTLEMGAGQGPSGVIGSDYTVRTEQISAGQFYRAEAVAGSAEGSNVWRIQKIVVSGVTVTITWASGTSAFNKNWTNRSSYTYS